MTEKITSKQENLIVDLVRDAVRALSLSKDEAREIIEVGGTLQEQVKPILQKLVMVDQRFGPAVKDFEFTVPADYAHNTQLDTFAKKAKGLKTTHYFNDELTSKNFAKATNKLVPGKTYQVRMFPILENVTSHDCLTFLKKQNAILVGGQGITLLQANKPDEFPVSKWTVSFDEEEALWEDADCYRGVPTVDRDSDGDWEFHIGYFERDWDEDDCLLCFCDKDT